MHCIVALRGEGPGLAEAGRRIRGADRSMERPQGGIVESGDTPIVDQAIQELVHTLKGDRRT